MNFSTIILEQTLNKMAEIKDIYIDIIENIRKLMEKIPTQDEKKIHETHHSLTNS